MEEHVGTNFLFNMRGMAWGNFEFDGDNIPHKKYDSSGIRLQMLVALKRNSWRDPHILSGPKLI